MDKKHQSPPRTGDVFELRTPDGRFGYALVVEGGSVPYIAIFSRLHDSRRAFFDELMDDEIALVGWTMDSWFYHNRWLIVGNLDAERLDVPRPNYIVGIDGEPHVTDFRGKVLGPPTNDEKVLLGHRASRAPLGFQNAFLALHGYRGWDAGDDTLTAGNARLRMSRA